MVRKRERMRNEKQHWQGNEQGTKNTVVVIVEVIE
jgi:hypothetical protein